MARVRISDVAAAAGVSTSTVSLVLNDRARRIPPETRERVRQAAVEVGYSPNTLARGLRTSRTRTIGMVTDTVASTPFAGRMVAGAQDAAREHRHLVIMVHTGMDPESEQEAIAALLDHQVDHLIYATMWHRPVPAVEGLPADAVYLDCYPEQGGARAVVPDDHTGGASAARELVRAGHRRIAFIDTEEPSAPIASPLRLAGLKSVLDDAGIEFDPRLHVRVDTTASGGYAGLQQLLAFPEETRPTGVFCFNDRIATGVYTAARHAGLEIPRDLSVVGYDDQDFVANELDPPLTTVALPHEAMGRWAAEVALGVREVRESDGVHRMECPLVRRQSVSPPLTSAPTSDSGGPTSPMSH